MMEKNEHVTGPGPMICDVETGMCEVPLADTDTEDADISAMRGTIRLLYFTDPICSSCWGIEGQLRKLKLEYGRYFEMEYRMGGLLKSWSSYGGSDVSGPTEVAKHWEEASDHYQMPIDGDLWLEDPMESSFPPSVAFKAAQMQGEDQAADFLRRIKEMVFLEKKNISKWEHLQQAAIAVGLDSERLKADFEGAANNAFEEDLALARQLGVRGFPTIFFTDKDDNRFKVYGAKPYEAYEQALLKLVPEAVKAKTITRVENLFEKYTSFTSREVAVIADKTREEAEAELVALYHEKKIKRYTSKKGMLWIKQS